MEENLKVIEGEIVPIYENKKGERLINARELHDALKSKRDFSNWINDRIKKYHFEENEDFLTILLKSNGGRPKREYILRIDVAKEICMIENNEIGRKIRKYFIEVEKRYRSIIESPQNIFDVMRLALDQIEENEKRLRGVETISRQNTKNGKKGEVKEQGYKIENVCYKIKVV